MRLSKSRTKIIKISLLNSKHSFNQYLTNQMIDEQYISKVINILVLCRMLLPLKNGMHKEAWDQFIADFDHSVSFLFHVSEILPNVMELDNIGKLYVANGKVTMLDGENEVSALLRWLKNNSRPNKRKKMYH